MEYPHGIHLLIDGIILDFDVIGIAVNPYNREGVLSKFCERNATTKKLPVYLSTDVREGYARLLLGKTFIDVNVDKGRIKEAKMPNWSSGKLKVRGKVKNVERFINESVNQYEYKYLDGKDKDTKIEKPPIDLTDGYEVDLSKASKPESYTRWFYIEKTARAFIEPGCYTIHHIGDDEIGVCFDFHQAWSIVPENFDDISDKYDLDIKIETTECGMCFTERYEKIRGQESTYDCPEYTDWFWDIYDPDLGG